MEDHNVDAALHNNTLGTCHAALAAADLTAERFVLIGADKALNWTNVMDATKLAAEMVAFARAADHPRTSLIAVRFDKIAIELTGLWPGRRWTGNRWPMPTTRCP